MKINKKGQPNSEEIGKRIHQQVFELWINPEIKRRKNSGNISSGFQLQRAQVIMNVDQPVQIRLNHEFEAIIKARVKKSFNKGDPVILNDFSDIESIELTGHDPNAGHISLFLHEGHCFISFDFRYNVQRSQDHIQTAKEFLATAHDCLEKQRTRAFMENLFAAYELLVKAWLLRMPLPSLLTSKKHSFLQTQWNQYRKLGNIPPEYTKMFNKISDQRKASRYLVL